MAFFDAMHTKKDVSPRCISTCVSLIRKQGFWVCLPPLEVFAVMEIESAFCLACFSIPINYIVPYPSIVYYIAANATDSLHYYHS